MCEELHKKMVSGSWLPLAIPTEWTRTEAGMAAAAESAQSMTWNGTRTASAARSEDGRRLVLRLTSRANESIRVQIKVDGDGDAWANASYVATVLSAPTLTAVNTAAAPMEVAPVKRPARRLGDVLDGCQARAAGAELCRVSRSARSRSNRE